MSDDLSAQLAAARQGDPDAAFAVGVWAASSTNVATSSHDPGQRARYVDSWFQSAALRGGTEWAWRAAQHFLDIGDGLAVRRWISRAVAAEAAAAGVDVDEDVFAPFLDGDGAVSGWDRSVLVVSPQDGHVAAALQRAADHLRLVGGMDLGAARAGGHGPFLHGGRAVLHRVDEAAAALRAIVGELRGLRRVRLRSAATDARTASEQAARDEAAHQLREQLLVERDRQTARLQGWADQAQGGDAEAAWRLARWHEQQPGSAYHAAADGWLDESARMGGAPYAWRAVDVLVGRDDGPGARAWTARALALQFPDPDAAVVVAPGVLAPPERADGLARGCDASFLVESAQAPRAAAALVRAAARLGLVDVAGREYADLAEAERAEEAAGSVTEAWELGVYTCSYVSPVTWSRSGPWLYLDVGDNLTGPMASTLVGIVVEELSAEGIRARVRSAWRVLDEEAHEQRP